MTFNEFKIVIQYLQSPDTEIVMLGQELGKQFNMQIMFEVANSWILTTLGWIPIPRFNKLQLDLEQLYAVSIW